MRCTTPHHRSGPARPRHGVVLRGGSEPRGSVIRAGPVLLGLLAALAGPRAAVGQEVSLVPRVGVGIPAGSLADAVDAGVSFGVGAAVRIHPRVSVRLGASLDDLGGQEVTVAEDLLTVRLPNVGLWRLAAAGEVDAIVPGLTPLTIVAGAGVGVAGFRERDVDRALLPAASDVSTLGTSAMAQVGLQAGWDFSRRWNAFVEGQAVAIFADETESATSQGRMGGTLWLVPITVGLRLRFY